ncbi:TonB-dependent siderophore receptor [Brevundimonas sp.]|uniref:TonB-dependent receptor plug domain-containing protein n=1 Tax=Brevundimonas sp. TaxID=1871086 RepID=UPI00261D607C|nr:TonB-dependent receptor [Brevundimonas sp.]
MPVLAVIMLAVPESVLAHSEQASSPPATAEGVSGVMSYEAGFFANASPTTALDMIARVPGFTMIETEEDVRGLSGATGNVLIDGQLPAAKSVSLRNFLQRIPADTVERIDLIRGGAPGIDMQGQAVVVNVIRIGGAYSTAAMQASAKVYPDASVGTQVRFEAGRNWDDFSLQGALSTREERIQSDGGEGPFSLRRPGGEIFEDGDFLADNWNHEIEGSLSGELTRGPGTLRVNAALSLGKTERNESYETISTTAGPIREVAESDFESDGGEISAAYQRRLSDLWLSEVLLVQTYERDVEVSGVSGRRAPENNNEVAVASETIGRATAVFEPSDTFRLELTAEGAFNSLDVESARTSGGLPVVLPVANVLIEESRAEGAALASWSPRDGFDLELSGRFETSTISLTGDAEQEKSLSFFKPRLLASWQVRPDTQLRFRLEREVGQLNFEDFAASSDVSEGVVSAGNPDLEPEVADVVEFTIEQRFWDRGALVLTLRHDEVGDVVDLIPINRLFDAPGNIGDGTRDAVTVSLTVPLERLGLSGGLLRFNGTRRWSSVTDPVTGEDRRISRERPFEGTFLLSRDVPAWNSSFFLEGDLPYSETSYRLRQVQRLDQSGWWKVYWEWRARPDLAFRFQIDNFTSRERTRTRTLFTGPRDKADVSAIESRSATFDPFFFMRLRKTF